MKRITDIIYNEYKIFYVRINIENSISNYYIENESPSINVIFNVFYDDIKILFLLIIVLKLVIFYK